MLTIAGDPKSLRARLRSAAEKLGYRIVGDDPIVAVRSGVAYGSLRSVTASVLDYARTLTFRLTPAGPSSTNVSFNYSGYPLNYKGARVVITREAEAIAALALIDQGAACSTCGAAAIDDSRFCRRCGVPVSGGPAELQVLKLTNLGLAGTKQLLFSASTCVLAVVTYVFILILKGSDYIGLATGLAVMWAFISVLLAIVGFRNLFRTFTSGQEEILAARSETLPLESHLSTSELSGLPPASVTEDTTNLLTPFRNDQVPVIVNKKNPNIS